MSTRRSAILGLNMKENQKQGEAEAHWLDFLAGYQPSDAASVTMFPTAPNLGMLALRQSEPPTPGICLGVQNFDLIRDTSGGVSNEPCGANTGFLSAAYWANWSPVVKAMLLGHSERRNLPNGFETDELIAAKLKQFVVDLDLLQRIQMWLCIGETEEQRKAEKTNEVLEAQLTAVLTDDIIAKICLYYEYFVIGYEPVWAIGTGLTASPDQAQDAHGFIRQLLGRLIGADTAALIRITYGGSVKPGNAEELMGKEDIDGALVGGASLEVASALGIWQHVRG